MADISFDFVDLKVDTAQHCCVLVEKSEELSSYLQSLDDHSQGGIARAIKAKKFKAKHGRSFEILGLQGLSQERLILLGTHQKEDDKEGDSLDPFMALGGHLYKALGKKCKEASLIIEEDRFTPHAIAQLCLGLSLAAYDFDLYKSQEQDEEDSSESEGNSLSLKVHVRSVDDVKQAWSESLPLAEGIMLARHVVNEPANVLGPHEFSQKAQDLSALGCEVEILNENEMEKLGMRALLGVSQGSAKDRSARLAIMRWNGGAKEDAPLAFVGKGVVFDTGGISLKPGSGMQDMKGDMGGAAAVLGLMHTVCARKAKANIIGVLGLVENMPDAYAQRPGDIVKAMNGTTIEIINTDAEGRLVLADALHYTIERFKPSSIINLATLTGAIVVALGHEYAGLYANDDALADALMKAGRESGDKVWRMPLGKAYDKLIESKFADIKNTGGRWAGSITAAQFLQRFVGDETPWAHLDIAGTAFESPKTAINRGWASGFGVALLNDYVSNEYE